MIENHRSGAGLADHARATRTWCAGCARPGSPAAGSTRAGSRAVSALRPVAAIAARSWRARAPASPAAAAGATRRSGHRLRFWAMGREGEVVQELVRDFERENPGHPRRGAADPLVRRPREAADRLSSGGSTPDLAQLGQHLDRRVRRPRALAPLEPLGRRLGRGRFRRRYFPGIWDTNVIDGVLYGVPWYVDTRVLFYRSDLLARGRLRLDARAPGTAGARPWRRSKRGGRGRTATPSSCPSTSGPSR